MPPRWPSFVSAQQEPPSPNKPRTGGSPVSPLSLEPVDTLYILAHPPPPPVTSSSNHCLPPIPPTPPPGPSSSIPSNRSSSKKYQRRALKSLPSSCERAFKMVLQLPRSYLTTPLLLFLLLLGANWVLPSADGSSAREQLWAEEAERRSKSPRNGAGEIR